MEEQLTNLMALAKETKQAQSISLPSMFGIYCGWRGDKGVTWTATPNEHGGVELNYKNN